MFGFFCVNKPPGPTSHDIVAAARRRLGRGVKVGHAGTLDPFADGVLVLCVGAATRLAEYVQALPKRYRATVRLGASSTTDDPEGEITPAGTAAPPDEPAVRRAVAGFVGAIRQVPPAHSAVHVAGRRAYRIARAGGEVRLEPRTVEVHAVEVLGYAWPDLEIDVRCGRGTYIRALARDIGAALGTGGYCAALRRTAVGPFRIEQAVGPGQVGPGGPLLPAGLAVAHLPRVVLTTAQAGRIAQGKRIEPPGPIEAPEVALFDPAGRLLAIARPRDRGRVLQPKRVFPAP